MSRTVRNAAPTTGPARVWIAVAHHAGFRCGGWASLVLDGAQRIGRAGGDRATTGRRMALAGLCAALRDLPRTDAPRPVRIDTASPELASLAGPLADALAGSPVGSGAADGDPDLWSAVLSAAAGRPVDIVTIAPAPGTPEAFVAAWADFAQDKAKAGGAFAAAIPRPNLAKVLGLG